MQKTILAIDNDRDNLDIIELILQNNGYKIVVSLHENIIDNISEINPDLILLDDRLDGKSGYEICKNLKEQSITKHIQVIIISAVKDLKEIATKCNADNFIEKPFDVDYLESIVKRTLQKR